MVGWCPHRLLEDQIEKTPWDLLTGVVGDQLSVEVEEALAWANAVRTASDLLKRISEVRI